ncbi:MAG: phosphogluconate dehydrogenase (NADP(+)-dependent, decarboxylating) [Flammeovirgaceae bacterium]|nr:phosphogluconate dehydrogenase (NADP(+)-dependent, decarboxylating) [Flammeovirgaceae bacterium]
MAQLYDFGLVGLGVMGRNFLLNVADHHFSAIGLDTDDKKVKDLKNEGQLDNIDGTIDKVEFINKLAKPRKIMLLVPAGEPVDHVITDLLPLLDSGDLIIDGGNSHFEDTNRRFHSLKSKDIHFMGAGISGGSEGARRGPSIMPGGDPKAYELIKPIFEAVAAKVSNEPCVDFMGQGSAGNYVKMIHNGIEYAMMQLIGESYHIMKLGLQQDNAQLKQTYFDWNKGDLQSFLIEITSQIFDKSDELTSSDLIDQILDKAKQKGTGKWTSQNAMNLGIAIPTIDAAVSMRQISSMKDARMKASVKYLQVTQDSLSQVSVEEVRDALYFAFIMSYVQGMDQLSRASKEYQYDLNLELIAKIWRGGCIIRARFLEAVRLAYKKDSSLESLLLSPVIVERVNAVVDNTRKVVQYTVAKGIPTLALSNSLNYFDAFKSAHLPLNLIQAQRDFFGSHTYERNDRQDVFHSDWN